MARKNKTYEQLIEEEIILTPPQKPYHPLDDEIFPRITIRDGIAIQFTRNDSNYIGALVKIFELGYNKDLVINMELATLQSKNSLDNRFYGDNNSLMRLFFDSSYRTGIFITEDEHAFIHKQIKESLT